MNPTTHSYNLLRRSWKAIAAGLCLIGAVQTHAASCSYTVVNQWNTGFQGSITITNNTTTALTGWTVGWTYSKNKITSSWNTTLSGSNPYTATNLSWNSNIQPGQSVSFGVQGDLNGGTAEVPSVSGSVCTSTQTSSSSTASTTPSSTSSSVATSSSTPSSSSLASSSTSTSSATTSSTASTSSSSTSTGQQCNWYGSLYPLCATTTSGWGYESGKSCISATTCSAQPAPYGIVGTSSSSSIASSVVNGSASSVKSASSTTSSSSSIAVSSSSSSSAATTTSSSSSTGVASLKALADFPIGVAVNAGSEANSIISSGTSAKQQAVVFPHFNQFTAGNIMKMSYLHPSEFTFTFTQADDLLTFANQNGIKMHAHTLIWHSDYQVPSFMKSYSGDFAAMLKTHVQTIAAHYSGKVTSWDVVNEALADDGDSTAVNGFRNSLFYQKLGSSYIDQAFINARAADPLADLYYNDYSIENNGTKTTNMLALIDGLKARGVPITGVGFQMHVLSSWPSNATIESVMKAVASRGLKVKITELDVRVNNPYDASATKYTSLTTEAAAIQKERYRQIVAAYLRAVPAAQRGGITVWGVWDTDSWLNTASSPDWPLLFDANFAAKPALEGFAMGLTGQ